MCGEPVPKLNDLGSKLSKQQLYMYMYMYMFGCLHTRIGLVLVHVHVCTLARAHLWLVDTRVHRFLIFYTSLQLRVYVPVTCDINTCRSQASALMNLTPHTVR